VLILAVLVIIGWFVDRLAFSHKRDICKWSTRAEFPTDTNVSPRLRSSC